MDQLKKYLGSVNIYAVLVSLVTARGLVFGLGFADALFIVPLIGMIAFKSWLNIGDQIRHYKLTYDTDLAEIKETMSTVKQKLFYKDVAETQTKQSVQNKRFF